MGLDGGTIMTRTDILRGTSWRLANANNGMRSTRGGQVGDDFVPLAQGRDKQGQQLAARARWESCSISGEPLRDPIMACYLGRLYNREAILEALLERDEVARAQLDDATRWRCQNWKQSGEFHHIESLKDVFVVRPTLQDALAASAPNEDIDDKGQRLVGTLGIASTTVSPDGNSISSRAVAGLSASLAAAASASVDASTSVSGSPRGIYGSAGSSGGSAGASLGLATMAADRLGGRREIVCPVSGVAAGGSYGFSALAPCGHLFSDRALRAVTGGACMTCGTPYSTARPSDIIPINGTSEQMEDLRAQLDERRAAMRKKKRDGGLQGKQKKPRKMES